ncbi:MAG: hypothetical protein OXU51_13855 [Candidatus Poribacteria bacterium]|nr:hypothetical protein [Candidatus Poribacteria bacterium]
MKLLCHHDPLSLGFQGKNRNRSQSDSRYIDDSPRIPCRMESENRIVNDSSNHENRSPRPLQLISRPNRQIQERYTADPSECYNGTRMGFHAGIPIE